MLLWSSSFTFRPASLVLFVTGQVALFRDHYPIPSAIVPNHNFDHVCDGSMHRWMLPFTAHPLGMAQCERSAWRSWYSPFTPSLWICLDRTAMYSKVPYNPTPWQTGTITAVGVNMATSRAKYAGNGSGTQIDDFSDSVKNLLRGFYPINEPINESPFDHPADEFVNVILSEAWWAKSEMHWIRYQATKQELRAEHADLQKRLEEVKYKLRHLTPDFDRLLGVDADPLGCADSIATLLGFVEDAGRTINNLPDKKKLNAKQHAIATELALRVLRVLKQYNIKVSATASDDHGYTSDAVKILKSVGDDIGLCRSESTWRDIIAGVKAQSPDLQ